LLTPDVAPTGPWRGRRWSSRQLHRLGEITAHAWAGVTVTVLAVGWVAYGAVAGFTAQWQAILSSTAAIVTVVMVFAIQHSQVREQAALQRKLDELLRALPGADNRLISVEAAPDGELQALAELNLAHREAGNPAPPA
jgi:low affinity Fe/Cu permease